MTLAAAPEGMPPLTFPDLPEEAATDPHHSKVDPNDPRLKVRPAPGRTLRKGPAVALVVALSALLAVALIFALLPPSKPLTLTKSPTDATSTPPPLALPESIRNAPGKPPPLASPPRRFAAVDAGSDDLGAPPFSGPNRRAAGGAAARNPDGDMALKARGASILFDTGRAPPSPAPAPSAPAIATPSAGSPPRTGSDLAGDDPNLQAHKAAFLADREAPSAEVLRTRLRHPASAYEVQAGSLIPAVLITALNSDLPGPVVAQVRENVYDTVTGTLLLIPQGSRLLAEYDANVSWGQERVLVCWRRLLFPNGDSLDLACMPAADLTGAAGLTDDVNEHWDRILKGAAVASLLAATTQAAAGNTTGFNPTVAQNWAHGTATEVNQVGQQITRRNLAIQPTISVRPGFSVNVLVTKDLVLPAAYPTPPALEPDPLP